MKLGAASREMCRCVSELTGVRITLGGGSPEEKTTTHGNRAISASYLVSRGMGPDQAMFRHCHMEKGESPSSAEHGPRGGYTRGLLLWLSPSSSEDLPPLMAILFCH